MSVQKETKKCKDCGEVKPFDDFYKKQEGNRFNSCKECFKAQVKAAKKDRHNKTYDHRRIKTGNRGKAKLLAFWQSIPAAIKDKQYFQKVKNVKISEKEEALLPKLLECRTITDLAELLEIEANTLRRWQKTNFVKRHTDKFDEWSNVMRFKKDVDFAFTQATIRNADAARVKLWYQIHMKWIEKSSNVNEFDENNILSIQKRLRELGTKELPEPLTININEASGDYEEFGADSGGFGEGEGDSSDLI